MSDDDILQAALEILPLLPGLLGPDAPRIASELRALLDLATQEPADAISDKILALLTSTSRTRTWLQARVGGTEYVRKSIGVPPPPEPLDFVRRSADDSNEEIENVELQDDSVAESGKSSPASAMRGTAKAIPPAPTVAPAPSGSNAVDKKPPRNVYALVDSPPTVTAEVEFDVTVGLSDRQSADVIGGSFVLPESTEYPYTLSLQLVAEGFDQVDGASWRQELTATAEAPYPKTALRLRAHAQKEAVRPRSLQVIYSIGGQTIGFAVRSIAVLHPGAEAPRLTPSEPTAGVDIRVPTESAAPDLTIHVLRDPHVRERLLWTIESPHSAVAQFSADAKAVSCDIGDQPSQFAKGLVQQVNQHEGKKSLALTMRGIGKTVAGKIPSAVWEAIRAATAVSDGPPNVLILSAEPYIPWELAYFPEPLPVPGAPPFLGTQANVGRWVLGHAKPKLPPPHELGITSMAVVWGKYDSSKWKRLESAEEEAAALRKDYGAESIDATLEPVLQCLTGAPPATALHFAIHGIYSPGGFQDGLVLTDEQTISPTQVTGGDLPSRPFVFLNACQVGSAQEVLGDYAGMASAFLQAGASAVIAPLWSIKDTIAKEICINFYRDAFEGDTIASVVRRQRAKYGRDNSATYLAYQYFGHPQLRTKREPPKP